MNCPNIYWINQLQNNTVTRAHPILKSVAARPLGYQGLNLPVRFKAAWLVFTGKADVVKWME